MAEIEFWRERFAVLSSLSEQLNLPVVKKILDVMTHADSFIMQELEKTTSDLRKYHDESASNVQFLTTMERHFRVRSNNSYVAAPHKNKSSLFIKCFVQYHLLQQLYSKNQCECLKNSVLEISIFYFQVQLQVQQSIPITKSLFR